MKQAKLMLVPALVAAIVIVAFLLGGRPSRSIESDAVSFAPATVPARQSASRRPFSGIAPPILAAPSQTSVTAPAIDVESIQLMSVRAGQVLATINNHQIQLKDLVALASDDTEMAMTAQEYQSRLTRAIEVELTFQAAQAQGLVLTAEQRQRLVRIGQNHKARLQEYTQEGLSWSSVSTAQLEFERRLMSALMLQQNLVSKEAAVAPSSNPTKQARYEDALREMLDQLESTSAIQISYSKYQTNR